MRSTNFSITILEYCNQNDCLKKEQQYIDLLSPEYNILKIAGSSLGYTHTDEAKAKISVANKGLNKGKDRSPETIAKFISSLDGVWAMEGKKHSEETRKKMSIAKQGEKHPIFNKTRVEKVGSPYVKLEVKNIITNEIQIYESISEAAAVLGIRQSTISAYLKRGQKSPYKNQYSFSNYFKN